MDYEDELQEEVEQLRLRVKSLESEVSNLKKKFEDVRDLLEKISYREEKKKSGRKPDPNSLRQRILRGEITRWEAYSKTDKSHKDS